MKLKKRSLLTVLAVAQLAAAYPASADANAADKTQPPVTQEVYEQNTAASNAVKSGANDTTQETPETTETEGAQETNNSGTTDVPVTEETGEVKDPATATEVQGNQNNSNSQQVASGKELILFLTAQK